MPRSPRDVPRYGRVIIGDGGVTQDGMLTVEELGRYSETLMTLTPAFVNRLFEVVHTYNGRLDYKGYLDFVITCEHRDHP